MPELDSTFALVAILSVVGLGLLFLVRSLRVKEFMSLANVPTVSAAEQDAIAKEQAAERAEFELAVAEELFECPSTLNTLHSTAENARAAATIARNNADRKPATEQTQPQLVPVKSRMAWLLRPGVTTAVRDRNNKR